MSAAMHAAREALDAEDLGHGITGRAHYVEAPEDGESDPGDDNAPDPA